MRSEVLENLSEGACYWKRGPATEYLLFAKCLSGRMANVEFSLTVPAGRSDGLRVNCMSPGAIDTPALATTTGLTAEQAEQAVAQYTSQIPLGRRGKPEEIAAAVVWLLIHRFFSTNSSCIAAM